MCQVLYEQQWLQFSSGRLPNLRLDQSRGKCAIYMASASVWKTSVVYVAGEGESYLSETWSLSGKGGLQDPLAALDRMDKQGVVPSVEIYRFLLERCTKLKILAKAKLVHSHIARNGLESCKYLGDLIVKMFVQCGSVADAVEVLYRLPLRTTFSWTQVISGCVKVGRERDAFELYKRMLEEGFQPNKYTYVSLLKACSKMSNVALGKTIHLDICKSKCDNELFVGTALVAMYAKCGSMTEARHVFDMLPHRDVVTWNVMIAGYSQQNCWEVALELYDEMKLQGRRPDSWTFVSVLQACGSLASEEHVTLVNNQNLKLKSLQYGKVIHSELPEFSEDHRVFVGTALLDMYAKCGSVLDAEHVFQDLQERSLISWNALLSGYVQQDQGIEALHLYELMLQEDISPDNWTFVSALKACGNLIEEPTFLNGAIVRAGCLQKGKVIFEYATKRGYRADLFLSNTLVDVYSDCGSLVDAWYVFDTSDVQSIVSWNAMIRAHVLHGHCNTALELYTHVQEEGVTPSNRTFVFALEACSMLADMKPVTLDYGEAVDLNRLQAGKAIHAAIIQAALLDDLHVANSLIHMYAKCGSMSDSRYVFDKLLDKNVVTWTHILTGYAEQDHGEKVIRLYAHMQESSVEPDLRTFVCVLKACCSIAAREQPTAMFEEMVKAESLNIGKRIQEHLFKMGLKLDVHVGTALVNMYAKCGSMNDALQIFEALPQLNVVSWTAMIAGYAEQGRADSALGLYARMREQGVHPDSYTFVSALKACVALMIAEQPVALNGENVKLHSMQTCKEVHSEVVRTENSDVIVSNSLIETYATCGSALTAQRVFDSMAHKDLVSWNTMLACYAQQERGEEALQLFAHMLEEAISPDNRTFVSVLLACSKLAFREQITVANGTSLKLECLQRVKAIHEQIDKRGYASNAYVCNTLVRTYAACGSMVDAQGVLDKLPERDVVTWTIMIVAYSEQGQNERAMQQYAQMRKEGVTPNRATFFGILRACSSAGSLTSCRQLHRDIVEAGLERDGRIATSLIQSYASCGSIEDAHNVFDSLPAPDLFSWTSLIAGYARQGEGETCLRLLQEMQLAGIKPNQVTLLAVLAGCSHAGLVEKGIQCFEAMVSADNLTPIVEHYVGLVDLLGRAGHFDRIREILACMPMEPNLAVWMSLLGSAQKHRNLEMGRVAFGRAMELDKRMSAPHVLMSNVYSTQLWEETNQVEDKVEAKIRAAGGLEVAWPDLVEQPWSGLRAGNDGHSALSNLHGPT